MQSFSHLCVLTTQTSEHIQPLSDYLCFETDISAVVLDESLELSDSTGWSVILCPRQRTA